MQLKNILTTLYEEVNIMKDNLVGELKIMKDLNIIPNCSALQRKYGTDRHTIK